MFILKNWRQKLGALFVAAVIWYLIKMHLQRRGSIPPVYDFVPGQAMGFDAPEPDASGQSALSPTPTRHVS